MHAGDLHARSLPPIRRIGSALAIATFVAAALGTSACGRLGGSGDSGAASGAASSQGPAGGGAKSAAPAVPDDMVLIQGGTITPTDYNNRKKPTETLKAYLIDKTEVTVVKFRGCVASGRCKEPKDAPLRKGGCNFFHKDREDHPMNCVPRTEATAYCGSVNKRLPSFAEWQFAAAGPEDRPYPQGSTKATKGQACYGKVDNTCPVGMHPQTTTPTGIQDMGGNVWEYSKDDECLGRPPKPEMCTRYVSLIHGGAWNSFDPGSLASRKVSQFIGEPPEAVGFRCVKEL